MRGKPCQPVSAASLKIIVNGRVRYPDAVVTCTPISRHTPTSSPSRSSCSRCSPTAPGTSTAWPRTPNTGPPRSIQHYVMLEQTAQAATIFSREGEAWTGDVLLTGQVHPRPARDRRRTAARGPLRRHHAAPTGRLTPRAFRAMLRPMPGTLPEPFAGWFAARAGPPRPINSPCWTRAGGRKRPPDRPHWRRQNTRRLPPGLVDLAENPTPRPAHNLHLPPESPGHRHRPQPGPVPSQDMGLPITIEARTGDTPANRRARQNRLPPHPPADHAGKPRRPALPP